jgi:hypothetical protein
MTYLLIDLPLTPFSTESEIKEWLITLAEMPETPEKSKALADAQKLLDDMP